MVGLIGAAAASFGLCVLAILALRPVAIALDLVDRPGGRKTHHGEVPIVGGIAMFIGVVLGLGLVPLDPAASLTFIGAASLLVTVGLLDDRFDLSPWMRLPAQIVAAIVLMIGANVAVLSLGDPFGVGDILLGTNASQVFTIVITVAAINAFNLLDGMDGIAGAMALIAFAALAWLAAVGQLPFATAASLAFAGTVAAFLAFNLPARYNRAIRCFMGDAGSTLLGFAVAWLAIEVSQGPRAAAAPVTLLWIVAVPLYELVWTTVRRVVSGVSPFRPDNDHFHHLLLKAGFGVRAAFTLLVVVAILLAAVGVGIERLGMPQSVSLGLLVVAGASFIRLMYRAHLLWALVPVSLRRVQPLDSVRPAKSQA